MRGHRRRGRSSAGRPPARHPLAWLLAVTVGTTWGTNSYGGEFVWGGLLIVAGFAAVVALAASALVG